MSTLKALVQHRLRDESPAAIAKAVGVSAITVHKWRSMGYPGHKPTLRPGPGGSPGTLVRLMDALGLDEFDRADWLNAAGVPALALTHGRREPPLPL